MVRTWYETCWTVSSREVTRQEIYVDRWTRQVSHVELIAGVEEAPVPNIRESWLLWCQCMDVVDNETFCIVHHLAREDRMVRMQRLVLGAREREVSTPSVTPKVRALPDLGQNFVYRRSLY